MDLSSIICAVMMATNMWNADTACKHMDTVVEASEEYSVPAELMNALILTESAWSPAAVSHAGACGLTQVMPKYTGGGATGGIKYTCEQLTSNPKLSIRLGTRIYRYWLTKYAKCSTKKCSKSQHRIALCGYNAGYRCKGENPNRHGMYYAKKVLERAARLSRLVQRHKATHKVD